MKDQARGEYMTVSGALEALLLEDGDEEWLAPYTAFITKLAERGYLSKTRPVVEAAWEFLGALEPEPRMELLEDMAVWWEGQRGQEAANGVGPGAP